MMPPEKFLISCLATKWDGQLFLKLDKSARFVIKIAPEKIFYPHKKSVIGLAIRPSSVAVRGSGSSTRF
jgi:hypothetical protein